MQSANDLFTLSENLNILHEHCREALYEESHERLYDFLYHYQQLIRDEIGRCLGTPASIKTITYQKNSLYSATYTYFKREILWHTLELSIFLCLTKDIIVSKDDNFLYPTEIIVMFSEALEQSALKQDVLLDTRLAYAIQIGETTVAHVDKFNQLNEQTSMKWRFITSYLGDLDREKELIDTEYLQKVSSTYVDYLAQQSEHLQLINTRAIKFASTFSHTDKQSHISAAILKAVNSHETQDIATIPYQEDSDSIDYFAESSSLPEECCEEMMIWLILLNSETLLQKKIKESFSKDYTSELMLQQLDYAATRMERLLAFFETRNNQLEAEIDSRLTDVEIHVSGVANAVEKLFSFTEDARKWTIQLMTHPEACACEPTNFEFDSSVVPVLAQGSKREDYMIIPRPMIEASGYKQPFSIFRIADKAYEESPQQKLRRFEEKLRQLSQDCQAERIYLKELLYIRFNQNNGLDTCEQTDKEQRENFQRTRNEFELTIKEWQVWQQTMFGYLADLGKEILETCDIAIDSSAAGVQNAGQECRK